MVKGADGIVITKTAGLACIPVEVGARLNIVRLSNGEGDWFVLDLFTNLTKIGRENSDKKQFKSIMKSHFSLDGRGVAVACAVAGVSSMMMNGNCVAQTFIAADYATNSTYASGWSAGQNGGDGFGPWSFDGTDPVPAGQYEGISTSSPLGTSWTLLTYDNHTGLADVGRAITEPGGLQPGQTLETVIENPTGYHFYRGWDMFPQRHGQQSRRC